MQNSKLICLFQTLSDQELRELKQFVRSPFHNQRQDVINLFDTLRTSKLSTITEKLLYKEIFPLSPFDKKNLAYTMNYLIKVIEAYFAIKELNKNEAQRQFMIAKAALEHQQGRIFNQKIKKAQKLLVSANEKNIDAYQLHYDIEMALYNQQKNQLRGDTLNLLQPSEHLDIIVITSKLRQACLLLAHENLSEVNYKHDLLNQMLSFLESPGQAHLLELPVIALYYFSYKTLKEEKHYHFQELKILLHQHYDAFSTGELRDFFAIAINFSIKQLNKGKRAYVQEAFDLYKEGLKRELLIENGTLSQFDYKNIAALGLGLKEYDWVEAFLIEHKQYLEPKNRALSFSYNLAKLHYEKGEYKAAMNLLQLVKYDESLPNLTSKILLMKIYFELGEKEALNSYLNSFERLVRRQRTLGYHKKSYLNLILLMRKLLYLKAWDKNAIRKFKESLGKKEVFLEKNWIIDQLEKKLDATKR